MVGAVDGVVWVKRALLLVIVGLVVQLFCLFDITPGALMIFAGLGVGLVGVGWLVLAVGWWKTRRERRGAGDG